MAVERIGENKVKQQQPSYSTRDYLKEGVSAVQNFAQSLPGGIWTAPGAMTQGGDSSTCGFQA